VGLLYQRIATDLTLKGKTMKRLVLVVCLFAVLAPCAHHAWAQQTASVPSLSVPSLYERLGGVYPIAVVVDAFIERLLVNDTLNANPAIARARAAVPKQGLKFHVTTLVCQATGGPCKYVGRSMKEAHQHLNITEKEWSAMMADFKATLDQFKVGQKEQQELFAIVEGTKPEIVLNGK
jgi:hemoglobin